MSTRDLVSVLAEHEWQRTYLNGVQECGCGDEGERDHCEHLAAVIEAEVIRPREREAWERGRSAATRTNPFAGKVE